MGIFSHLFILFTPQGRGENFEEQMLSKQEIEQVKRKLENYREKTGFYVRLYDYDEYEHSCVLITPRGDLVSQALYEKDCITVGNVLEEPLEELFKSDSFDHFTHLSHYLQKRRIK